MQKAEGKEVGVYIRLGKDRYADKRSVPIVKQLTELLNQVKDEQSYIIVRERTHRNTAESTNARVKWWSIFQLGVLIGEGIFQVWWLKRFFEVGGSWVLYDKIKGRLTNFSQVKRVV